MIICAHCGLEKEPDSRNPHLCYECVKTYNNKLSHNRRHQDNWLEIAQAEGLEPYEKQPGETQLEWTIWQCYRDFYPGRKPKYKDVAAKAGSTVEYVKKTASRWSFNIRMQAWMTAVDRDTELQRRQAIIDMNRDHIEMAEKLRSKLNAAIDYLDPQFMKPSDIVAMSKMAADLERTARIDELTQLQTQEELSRDTDNPELKQSTTKSSDLSEVVSILMNAGALGSITQIGVRETTTTTREVVAKGDDTIIVDKE